jgi:hypothetical protein
MASESLKFVNAIIGFCTPTKTWPHPLADLGYVACGVEREITVDLGGQNRQVVVDLICASPELDHALCAETKTRIVPVDQARRYRAMASRDLINMANLPTSINPNDLTHDVIYVAAQDNAEEVIRQLEDSANPFPVLGCAEARFALHGGVVSQAELHVLLNNGIAIHLGQDDWPLGYLPFTSQSEDSEIVVPLAQMIAVFLIRGADFTVEDLAQTALPNWHWFGRREQRELNRRFSQLVDSAMRRELNGYYRRPDALQRWVVSQGPLRPPNQTTRLAESMEEFVARIRYDIPFQAGLSGEFADV